MSNLALQCNVPPADILEYFKIDRFRSSLKNLTRLEETIESLRKQKAQDNTWQRRVDLYLLSRAFNNGYFSYMDTKANILLTKMLLFITQVLIVDPDQLPYTNFLKVHPGNLTSDMKDAVELQ